MTDTDRLAALLHDALVAEGDPHPRWRWATDIEKAHARALAARLIAQGVRVRDDGLRDVVALRERLIGATPWYDETDPDYTEFDSILKEALEGVRVGDDARGLRAAAWEAVHWLESGRTDNAEGDAATASRLRAALAAQPAPKEADR